MIGVLVSGEGTNLQALIDAGLPVVAVASNRPGRARARARAARRASRPRSFDAADYDSREERDVALANGCSRHGVELVVCAGYMHLFRRPFFDYYGGRIVNTHPAPLPEFPGAHPIEDVLAAGVAATGGDGALRRRRSRHGPGDHAEECRAPGDTADAARARAGGRAPAAPQVVRELCAR